MKQMINIFILRAIIVSIQNEEHLGDKMSATNRTELCNTDTRNISIQYLLSTPYMFTADFNINRSSFIEHK